MSIDAFEFQDLETNRLFLRKISIVDINFIFKQFNNPMVSKYLMDEPSITQYKQAEGIINYYINTTGNTRNRWIIIKKDENQPIGTCGFHKWEKQYYRAEIGYDLNPPYWGKGFMREALSASICYGFSQMQLHRIDALVYIENERSNLLLQKLGFTKEGILRDYFYLNETFYDHYLWSLLQMEWNQ